MIERKIKKRVSCGLYYQRERDIVYSMIESERGELMEISSQEYKFIVERRQEQ